MAHPMAGAAMTFPNTWLNECLHSVKKKKLISGCGLERSVKRKKKRVIFTVTEINLSRERSRRSVWRRESAGK